MSQGTILRSLLCLVLLSPSVLLQHLEGQPYRPGVDPNIDMFLGSWNESMPRHTRLITDASPFGSIGLLWWTRLDLKGRPPAFQADAVLLCCIWKGER